MRRSTRWFIGFMTVAVALCAGIVTMGLLTSDRAVVRAGSILAIDLEGAWPEHDPNASLNELLGVDVVTLGDLVAAIDAAAGDDRVEAIELRIGLVDVGWAKAQEIRQALARFRESGKPVHAFMEYGNDGTYFIASVADEVHMIETGTLWLDGISAEVGFYAGTLSKLGVSADLEQIGEYKNAADVMERTSMTVEHREAMESLVDALYEEMITAVAESLGRDPVEVRAIVSAGPYTAEGALEAGLVDDLAFLDQARAALDEAVGGPGERIELADYVDGMPRTEGGAVVALVHCVGTIVPGESSDGLFGGSVMGSDTIAEAIEDAGEVGGLRALVLRVDSPGGSPVASDVIWRATQRVREQGVKVVVSMSDVAASGGYWISMGADHVVAQPSTLTGSIGIYGGKYVTSGLQEKIALATEPVERGANAGINSTRQPFTEAQRAWLQSSLRATYDLFLARTAMGRGFESVDDVDRIARGRVWTGRQALANGLVDEVGGLREALVAARRLAGLPEDAPVDVRTYPRSPTLMELLFREGAAGTGARLVAAAVRIEARRSVPRELGEAAEQGGLLGRLADEGVLAFSPVRVPAR